MTGTAVPPTGRAAAAPAAPRLSALNATLRPSLILSIAAEVREMMAGGKPVCNLTVGDFDPKQFPVPERLANRLAELVRTETNYPPSAGMPQLRAAVPKFYKEWLGLDYSDANVVACAGGRPAIYAAYRILVDEGDKVLYPTPSWSNEYYAPIVGAAAVEVPCGPESG